MEAEKVSLGGYLGSTAELENMEPEFHSLEKFALRQVDALDAIIRKLS